MRREGSRLGTAPLPGQTGHSVSVGFDMLRLLTASRLDQTIANGVAHEIGETGQVELEHGGSSMGFHRLQRHIEDGPDLLVRVTFSRQSHDAHLPVTKSLFFPHLPTGRS